MELDTLFNLGNIHSDLGKLKLARQYYGKAYNLAKERRNEEYLARVCEAAARHFAKNFQFQDALKVLLATDSVWRVLPRNVP